MGVVALTALGQGVYAQDSGIRSKASHKKTVAAKPASHRQMRAVLAPSDFPITLSAFDRANPSEGTTTTVLEISKSAFGGGKPTPIYTKVLDGEQISSVVSWQNAERTHYGFLVLTTPSDGNLYNVLFYLYHDGKLTLPINDVATGYPVFPTIRRSDKTGQIQISFDDGSGDATNDKQKTVVLYTWSDTTRRFVKNMHEVAAESVERTNVKRSRGSRIEKTKAAGDGNYGRVGFFSPPPQVRNPLIFWPYLLGPTGLQ